MRLRLITETNELEGIADEWRKLALPSPLQSPDWLIPWWQVYQNSKRELAVLAVRDSGGALVALCPWYVEARSTGRSLRWLGDGAACSDHASILLAQNASSDLIHGLVEWIHEFDLLHWTQLELEAVNADDPLFGSLTSGIRRCDWLVRAPEDAGSCYIALPSSWEDYLAAVSKNHRKRCRKWQRDFFDIGRARVDVVTEPADCVAAYEQLVILHNERRHSSGGSGAFENAKFSCFHRLATQRLARAGCVQLRLLSIDQRLAAVEYVLTDDTTFYAYQSGLSDTGAEVSAGSLSILSLIRAAIDGGRHRVDLLRGVEPYKFSWGAVHRPAHTIVARRRTVAGLLQTYLDKALQQARCMRRLPAKAMLSK